MIQSHAWTKILQVNEFQWLECETFLNMTSDSILQLTFKKLLLVECWYNNNREDIHNYVLSFLKFDLPLF